MQIIEKTLKELKPYPNNPRNNSKAVAPVKESILKFGFKVPLVVDKNNVIVCGHTRYYASKEIGLEKVPCVVADDLTQEQIDAFRLVDNRTAEFAEWNFDKLAEELSSIPDFNLDAFDFDGLMAGFKYKTHKEKEGILKRSFLVSPFSILDTRSGTWQERKRVWNSFIGDKVQARENAKSLPPPSLTPGMLEVSLLDSVLAEVLCRWFVPNKTKETQKTFDCFAGDTVFGFVSSYLGNEFVGIELRKEQADFNNSRVKEFNLNAKYICDDGRNVAKHLEPESQDFLFSCPPYFDLEVYSDDPKDASNQKTYEDFLNILDTAFSEALKCLKNNRFAVVVCGDVRNKKNGEYYCFPQDIVKIFKKNGVGLYNEIILINVVGSAHLRAAHNMKSRKVVKVHQNVLVFYKGDTKEIKNNFENLKQEEDTKNESQDL